VRLRRGIAMAITFGRDRDQRLAGRSGSVQKLVVASRDITAQQQAAERLREDEGRHRAVMESAADAILLSDDEGQYVDANPVALVMTGYTIDELRQLKGSSW